MLEFSESSNAALRATSAVATAIVVASIPITILPSTSGAIGEAWIRTMRMRKAARGGLRSLYVAAGQKASAERPAEMLLDGSPIQRWTNRLRALSSALSRGNNEETWHRAGQIAELKAG